MTPARWLQVKELFHTALALAPDERARFLAAECQDQDELRQDVESLIIAHDLTGSFIDSPAYEIAADTLVSDQSELSAGQLVGPYEVVSTLGKGGMGEVYLAQDKRLGRKVALKLLPSQFSKQTDRLRRFEQEAQAASALNQPNIVTIHEIGKFSSLPYIITEYVEGESLRQRLKKDQIKSLEALDIAIQIASALSAAHDAGIVHRDIKPENVMLRRDRLVKVLDFGLAKLAVGPTSPVDMEAATRAMVNTEAGLVMGTVTYMSPEQASGIEVDTRTDIWSLGIVLYEIVAGRPPFEGETPTQVIAKILERESDPVSLYAPGIPPDLERIIARAINKRREDRYQTIKEMRSELQTLKQEMEFAAKLERSGKARSPDHDDAPAARSKNQVVVNSFGPITVGGRPPHSDVERPAPGTGDIRQAVATISQSLSLQIKRHKIRFALLLAGLIIACIGTAFAVYKFRARTPPAPPFQSFTITPLTNQGNTTHATISPDGKYCAYILHEVLPGQIKESVLIRQITAANDRVIIPPDGLEGGYGLTFSPDGNDLYFVPHPPGKGGALYRVAAFGGTAIKLLESIDSPISFSPDGRKITFLRQAYPDSSQSGLFVAAADGSDVQQIASRRAPEQLGKAVFSGPSWSPDGKSVACSLDKFQSGSQLITVNVADGEQHALTTESWASIAKVEWLRDMSGLLMVAKQKPSDIEQVWLVPYPLGTPRRITSDLNSYRDISITSDSRKFVTLRVDYRSSVWLVPEGDSKRAIELPTGNIGFLTWGSDNALSWTPDSHIVYVSFASGSPEIWIMDSDGDNRRQLTNGGYNVGPSISADGHYIVFVSGRTGGHNIWRMGLDGNEATQLTKSGAADFKPIVTSDNHWVVYTAEISGKLSLWKVSIAGGNPEMLIDKQVRAPAVSPDGKLIAYLYEEPQTSLYAVPDKVAIASLVTGETVKTFDLKARPNFADLRWTADGRALTYAIRENLWQQELTGGPPIQITNFSDLDRAMVAFAWSPDGKQLICQRGRPVRDAVLITDAATEH